MKCPKCNFKNHYLASYCNNCGYKYNDKEKEKSENRSFIGLLKGIDKLMSILDLSIINDKWYYKLVTLLGVLFIGFITFTNYGNHLKLVNSNEYKIEYNTNSNEYYLLSNNKEINLSLFIPNKVKKININYYDNNDNLINSNTYDSNSEIKLISSSNNDYYILEGIYNENNLDRLKLYIYEVDNEE